MIKLLTSLIISTFFIGCVEDPEFSCSGKDIPNDAFRENLVVQHQENKDLFYIDFFYHPYDFQHQVYFNSLECENDSCKFSYLASYNYEDFKLTPLPDAIFGEFPATYRVCEYDQGGFILENSDGKHEHFTRLKDSLKIFDKYTDSPYDQVYPDTTYKDTSSIDD